MTQRKNDAPDWIAFDADMWEGGIAGLTPEAEYVYFRICKSIWSNGKPVFLEQLGPLCRGMKTVSVAFDELVRARKVTINNGLIRNRQAENAYKKARKILQTNRRKTRAAIQARKKRPLTPGKEKENPLDCNIDRDMQRNRGRVEKSREERITSIPSSKSVYINSNSKAEKNLKNKDDGIEDDGNENGKVGTLKTITYEKAKAVAPGYDIYYLERLWRDWSGSTPLKNKDKAFLGFAKRHAEKNPL